MHIISRLASSRLLLAMLFLLAVALFFVLFGEAYYAALAMPDILIAPIMTLGSFVAGSTFLGGGAVAFPALTKILHADPITAKNFSLAIQSVGMTSASIYILLRVRTIPGAFLQYYLPGSAIGLLLSLTLLEQHLTGNDLRVGFTLFVLVFMLVYLWAYLSKQKHFSDLGELTAIDKNLIIKAGLLGGILSGLLGSGADLVAFCLLALYFRVDIKLATQTSVLIMAATSVLGVGLQGIVFNKLSTEVLTLWMLAAPVVIIGAPLGAIFCRRATTKTLLVFIGFIVTAEIVSTILLVPLEKNRLGYYLLLVLASISLLVILNKISKRKQHKDQHVLEEPNLK